MAVNSVIGFNRFVFWEPILSPHKADLYRAIKSLRPNCDIVVVADREIGSDRARLGWSSPVASDFILHVSPGAENCRNIVLDDVGSTLHVFSGIRWHHVIEDGLSCVLKNDCQFVILSEPRASEGLKGILRRIHSLMTEQTIRKKVKFVLAIGRNGPSWYKSVLYDPTKIFGFAYFVDPVINECATSYFTDAVEEERCRVGYVGRLTAMKGVQYFLNSFRYIDSFKFSGAVVGTGEDELDLRTQSEQLPVHIDFHGAMDMDSTRRFMKNLDILVLPSISSDDGWGVVVSEALLAGCAVVCTSEVGSSIVLNNERLGVLVESKSGRAIAYAIQKIKTQGMLTKNERDFRAAWARENLVGNSGAKYFLSLVDYFYAEGPRPTPILGFK